MFQAYLRILLRHKRVLIVGPFVASLMGFGISYVLPQVYESETTLLPREGNSQFSALFAGLAGQAGGTLPMGLLGGNNKGADLKEVALSRTVLDRVIDKLGLAKKFEDLDSRDALRKKVRKMVKVVPPTLKNNVLIIRAEANDAQLAADLANTYVDEIKILLDEIGYSDATKTRRFVETQLSRAKDELATAEQSLTEYQAESKLVSLPEAVQSTIKVLSDLEATRIQSSMALSETEASLGQLEKYVDSLQTDPNQLLALKVKNQGLKAQQEAVSLAQRKLLAQMNELPPKAMKLARLERDLQVKNAIYLALTQQYETAIITEAKDSEAFYSLDAAIPAEKPERPKKLLNLLIGAILGGIASLWVVFILELRTRSHRATSNTPDAMPRV